MQGSIKILFSSVLIVYILLNCSNDESLGKRIIILSGDITDEEANQRINADFGSLTEEVRIKGCVKLRNVNLSLVRSLIDLTIEDSPVLESVDLSGLTSIEGTTSIMGNDQLRSLDFAALNNIAGDLTVLRNNLLRSLNFPVLIKSYNIGIFYNLSLEYFEAPRLRESTRLELEDNQKLSTVNVESLNAIGQFVVKGSGCATLTFAELEHGGNIAVYSNGSLIEIYFPLLKSVETVHLSGQHALNTIDFPTLTQVNSMVIEINNKLSSVSIPTLGSIELLVLAGNKLSTENINSILSKLVAITPPLTGKIISLRQGVQPCFSCQPAPPSGQGLIDKATLISNGNTVITD